MQRTVNFCVFSLIKKFERVFIVRSAEKKRKNSENSRSEILISLPNFRFDSEQAWYQLLLNEERLLAYFGFDKELLVRDEKTHLPRALITKLVQTKVLECL